MKSRFRTVRLGSFAPSFAKKPVLGCALLLLGIPLFAQQKLEKPSSGTANTHAIAFNPAVRKVYAVDSTRASVEVVDVASQAVSHVAVGPAPVSIAVNEKNGMVYVANAGDATVSVIDGTKDAVVATIRVAVRPYFIAADSVAGKIYVSHTFSNKTSIIDCATNTAKQLATGSIDLIAVDEASNTAYLLGYEGGSLTVLDGAHLTTTRREAGKHAWGMAANEITHKLYIARVGTGDVIAIDGAASTVVPAGHTTTSIAIDSKTNRIYAGNYADGTVTVIDGATARAVATVPVGEHPQAVAVDPVRNLVFAANTKSGTVTVIDGASNKALATLPAGHSPSAIAVDPGSSRVYVANEVGPNPLTVVDLSNLVGFRR